MRRLALCGWWLVCTLITAVGGIKLWMYYSNLPLEMDGLLEMAIRVGFFVFLHDAVPDPEDITAMALILYLVGSITLVGVFVGIGGALLWQYVVTRRCTVMERGKKLYRKSLATPWGGGLWAMTSYLCVLIATYHCLEFAVARRWPGACAWAFVSLIVVPLVIVAAMPRAWRCGWLKGFLGGTAGLWILSVYIAYEVLALGFGLG